MVVDESVNERDKVLDCGAGTGLTALLAAKKVGADGKVTLFDLSEDILNVAKEKILNEGMKERVDYKIGDMEKLPFWPFLVLIAEKSAT